MPLYESARFGECHRYDRKDITMEIYKLTHQKHIEYKLHTAEWVTDDKIIGFFTSPESADKVKSVLCLKEEFADSPEAFTLNRYTVGDESATDVYYVEHSFYVEDERTDNIVEIGVFATEAEAMIAAAEYEKTARFPVGTHSWEEDFDIDNYLSVAKYTLDMADFSD